MTSYYWIKLYHEILDDPKMALLPDRLWRRVVELFLLAGKHGTDGQLPDSRQLAWLLRMNPDELEMDLKQIETTGMIERLTNGWLVVNFAKRQAAIPGAERTQQHRKRAKQQQYYDDVTQVKQVVTQNQINRIDTDINTTTTGAIFRSYEANIGPIVQKVSEDIKDLIEDYPPEWIIESFEIAAVQNKRNLAYSKAILKRWQAEGKDDGTLPKKNGTRAPSRAEPAGFAAIREYMEEQANGNV